MARKKIQLAEVSSLPTSIEKGSHLTVTTYPDGRTELEWDDVALLNDVREAIKSAELANMKPAVKAKSKKLVAKSK
jgi:hypothetical protein